MKHCIKSQMIYSMHRFWESAQKIATPNATEHFRSSVRGYLKTNITQAEDSAQEALRSVETCFPYRRQGAAILPVSFVIEIMLNIPDEVLNHPVVNDLQNVITDMIIIDNVSATNNQFSVNGQSIQNSSRIFAPTTRTRLSTTIVRTLSRSRCVSITLMQTRPWRGPVVSTKNSRKDIIVSPRKCHRSVQRLTGISKSTLRI
jgi:hypothetical protein